MDKKSLFSELLGADTESAVEVILKSHGILNNPDYWDNYGGSRSNYGVFENQQSHAVAALVEKITNGIDAILERRCLEEGIDPKSEQAPRSLEMALDKFFPNRKNWDISSERKKQAQNIQIIADGPKFETSLLIYDNGIGQKPAEFPNTFLSLLKGNKNDVHFVQGKYNMGGTGAIAFCGKKRYQLIASRYYDKNHPLGYTLIRRHPWTQEETEKFKMTWYEYLVFNKQIPSFEIDTIDAGLEGRKFETGSLIKLYSYDLPVGSRSVITRDLNLSLNEFLYEPALPFLTIDNEIRYPKHRVFSNPVIGLKKRLEADTDYIEDTFSVERYTKGIGTLKVSVFVFKAKSANKNVKETKEYIRREYFKNNMSVLFTLNGQVHASFTSEFITRSLKFSLLRDYVLIHVDCTKLDAEVRNEMFMASRDRLKDSETLSSIRKILTNILSDSKLKEILKRRKANLNVESGETNKILTDVYQNLAKNSDLSKLLKMTLDISDKLPVETNAKIPNGEKKPDREPREIPPFESKRFPTSFQLQGGDSNQNDMRLFKLPINGNRTVRFLTDVENEYFDRSDEPGDLQIIPIKLENDTEPSRDTTNGDARGEVDPRDVLTIDKSNPEEGTIKIKFNPTADAKVGDTIEIRAILSAPGKHLDEIFLVKIVNKTVPKEKAKPDPEPNVGLPELIICSREGGEGRLSWSKCESSGDDFDHNKVVDMIESDEGNENSLEKIIINVDSTAFQNFRSKVKTTEEYEVAEKRFICSVYFHTLFLYTTTKSRKYNFYRDQDQDNELEVREYISDLFSTSYAQFLLNFDMKEMLDMLS